MHVMRGLGSKNLEAQTQSQTYNRYQRGADGYRVVLVVIKFAAQTCNQVFFSLAQTH